MNKRYAPFNAGATGEMLLHRLPVTAHEDDRRQRIQQDGDVEQRRHHNGRWTSSYPKGCRYDKIKDWDVHRDDRAKRLNLRALFSIILSGNVPVFPRKLRLPNVTKCADVPCHFPRVQAFVHADEL